MSNISIYKINKEKTNDFLKTINENFEELELKRITLDKDESYDFNKHTFDMGLYYDDNDKTRKIDWAWIFRDFGVDEDRFQKCNPRGIVTIEYEEEMYALSFSFAYSYVDKFCDNEFAYEFAKRFLLSNIKTTSLTNPNSKRNKTVNTYVEYDYLEFESGESLDTLKAKIEIEDEEFNLFSSNIEIGHSIKLSVKDISLKSVGNALLFIINAIRNYSIKTHIPLFKEIKDDETISLLEGRMLSEITNSSDIEIEFSEYQIFGTKIIFHQIEHYRILYKRKEFDLDNLSQDYIQSIVNDCEYDLTDFIEKAKLVVFLEGGFHYKELLKKSIYFTSESKNAVFTNGKWYEYNNDYLNYLRETIMDIEVEYNPELDFSAKKYFDFLNSKYNEEKDNEEYKGKSEKLIERSIKAKYYKERYYNISLIGDGYLNFDRDLQMLGKHKIEVMDLYKDNTMHTVKIGNSSSKLCFAVEQSIVAVELYKKQQLSEEIEDVRNVALNLILERKDELSIIDGKVNIDELQMIILKNRIAYWIKDVRRYGLTPKIYINYIKD